MEKTKFVRQLRHGQMTIPKEFREAMHLGSDDMLAVTLRGDKLQVEAVRTDASTTGSQWARDLYEMFAPVRKSLEGYTEQEINDAIDEALRAYRSDEE